jgi:hypothetical protein
MVLFDQATYDKLLTEAPKFKLVTPSILSDRLRVCSRLVFSLFICFFAWFSTCCNYDHTTSVVRVYTSHNHWDM